MRRWDALAGAYIEEYRARGVGDSYVTNVEREMERWGAWLKRRRPKPRLEEISADACDEVGQVRVHCDRRTGIALLGKSQVPVGIKGRGIPVRIAHHDVAVPARADAKIRERKRAPLGFACRAGAGEQDLAVAADEPRVQALRGRDLDRRQAVGGFAVTASAP